MSLSEDKLEILRPLEDVSLNDVGLTGVFECEISIGGLKPEWSKSNKVLKSDGRVSIIIDGNVHRLSITEASGEDEGQYTVNFKEQNVKSSAKLTVKGLLICGCKLFKPMMPIYNH